MRGKNLKNYRKDQIIYGGLSWLHPGTHRQEHPLPWWHFCRATAVQSHSRQLCAPPASRVSVPPFPGVLLLRGKGKCCSMGHPQMCQGLAEQWVPAPWGTPKGKRHLQDPSSRAPCPQCPWWCSCREMAEVPEGAATTSGPGGGLGGPWGGLDREIQTLELFLTWRWQRWVLGLPGAGVTMGCSVGCRGALQGLGGNRGCWGAMRAQ